MSTRTFNAFVDAIAFPSTTTQAMQCEIKNNKKYNPKKGKYNM